MKTDKQVTTKKSAADSEDKKDNKKKSSTAARAKGMDMPAATTRAKARDGRNLPGNQGTIHSYEENS